MMSRATGAEQCFKRVPHAEIGAMNMHCCGNVRYPIEVRRGTNEKVYLGAVGEHPPRKTRTDKSGSSGDEEELAGNFICAQSELD